MKPLLLISILTILYSCSQPVPEQQSENSAPKSEVFFPDTGDFYVYREYFDNDTISLEVGMKGNQMTGFRKSFYPNGSPKEFVQIKGIYPTDYCCPDGDYKVYYDNGKLKEIHRKENGEFQGLFTLFDSLGNKKAEHQVLNGLKHGQTKIFYPSGTIKAIYEYDQDTLVGTAYLFRESGDSLKKYTLFKGNMDFPITYWKEDGKSLTGEYYKDQFFKVKWTWRDSENNIIKQEVVDTIKGQFVTPDY